MTTEPGDLVVDITCGSGTTAYAAEQWGRRWITVDTSRVPIALARQRLLTSTFPWYKLKEPSKGPTGGFVYERKRNNKGEEVGGLVPRITLKSIANDEDPKLETIADRAEVNDKVTRVCGPFTVEATIQAAMSMDDDAPQQASQPQSSSPRAYLDRMIEVLRQSKTLRLPGNVTLELETVSPLADREFLHAEGIARNGTEMLDTNYNGMAFFASQVFFPKTSAWDNLQKSLKGQFADSVWEHLAGTESEPFAAGDMGMLSAWSILNRVASPRDDRFSDTVLVVCPNVTIRERLQELDPALGDVSLYRTRQLVPPHRMEELRRGEVMIANWHRLAKKETNSVNGDSAKVVKTGEPVQVVKNAGKANESVETKYFESDSAWFKRIRRELGSGKGRSSRWLIFNDEAHHAYRRGDTDEDSQTLDDDKELAKKNAREATIWIEGLDRINKLAAGSNRRGINLCVDLSATPFYIQGSGNEVGQPFPWVVSDFGLLDAIESGLVKIPQLPSRDVSGADEAAYFNIWRWVQAKAKEDGFGTTLTPEIVMNYASAPINLLAAEWRRDFVQWEQTSKEQHKHPVPPVFIVVCRDTAVAKEVHSWLANGNDSYGVAPEWFRNTPGQEVTVRIDSKVVEDIEEGGTKDETRRLRFILDTVGKAEWPGGKVPEEWSELVRKHNDKVASEDNDGSLKWIDERIPPGRDVRCIVSVAMLAEGWDANTVKHIIGLRPFGSQLLCEQVVGRALRRKSYALNEETQMFAEETAKVFGVPFELIPFKVSPPGPTPPQPEPNHIYSVPEKAEFEITFPVVTGYHQSGQFDVFVDWDQVAKVTIDPMKIPQIVELTPLTSPDGALAAFGPGEKPVLSLKEWRALFREQQVAFRLAKEICSRWAADNGAAAVPMQVLFPKVAFAAKRFLAEKLDRKGGSQPCDVLLVGEYMQAAVGSLLEAIKKGASTADAEVAVVPQGAAGRGSTLFVDFHTTKPIYPVTNCHLNAMVADTQKWEQSAAFLLDSHPGVVRWVKNDRLGFFVPYRNRGVPARYIPDFIAVTDKGLNVVVEIKGQVTDSADAKAKAAERWVAAVNRLGQYGEWHYLMVTDPGRMAEEVNPFANAQWSEGPFTLTSPAG